MAIELAGNRPHPEPRGPPANRLRSGWVARDQGQDYGQLSAHPKGGGVAIAPRGLAALCVRAQPMKICGASGAA